MKFECVCIHSAYMRNEERVFNVYIQFKHKTYNNQNNALKNGDV